jgi:hypothetical protein
VSPLRWSIELFPSVIYKPQTNRDVTQMARDNAMRSRTIASNHSLMENTFLSVGFLLVSFAETGL